jgi:diguanylate cyclase (GGDEF)-like protein
VAKILVVDDRPTNLEYLTTLVGYAGHLAIEAADGAAALEIARHEHPDLIITDILMPTMNGYELVEHLRESPGLKGVPIIFYTATYRASEAERLADACGVRLVLPKPAEPHEILRAIESVLGPNPNRLNQRAAAPSPAITSADQGGLSAVFRHYLNELESLKPLFDDAAAIAEEDRQIGSVRNYAQRIRHVGDRMQAMVQLGLELCAERDPQRILERLVEAICDLVDASEAAICAIGSADPGRRHVRVHGSLYAQWFSTPDIESDGWLRAIVRENRTLRFHAARGALERDGLPEDHPPVGAFLGAPLISRTETIGWVYFTRRPGRGPFSDEDEFIVSTLAASAAMFYENAHVFDLVQRHAAHLQLEVTERRRAEAQVRRLNRILGVLTSINNLIVRTRDRDELFNEACRIVVEQGQFRTAWITSVRDGAFALLAQYGAAQISAAPFEIRVGDPNLAPIGLALRGHKPYICNDVHTDPLGPVLSDWMDSIGVRSLIVLPLIVAGKMDGSISMGASEAGFFSDEEIMHLEELAHDIAFAMEFIEREERLGFLARHDPMTGLANRALLEERLGEHIAAARKGKELVGLLVMDLDRFKAINDRLGFAVGDDVLRRFAERLREFAGDDSHVARISGDRYAVIVPDLRKAGDLGDLLRERIWDKLDEPMPVNGEDLRLSAKIGIAVFPDDGDVAEILIRNAEAALKKAKASGDRYLFYTQQMSDAMKQRLTMEGRLQQALARSEFVVHYQPQVELRTGVVRGAEALIRWNSPDLGLVSPGQFISLLEETGLIIDVGLWVAEQANRDYCAWLEAGLQAPRVSVNVSTLQLRQPDFVDRMGRLLKPDGKMPPGIDFELTESLMMSDVESSIAKLRAIRELGATLAIDDFGTGFSSLAYLARLPIGTIKIDRSFVVRMTDSPDDMSIVSTIIGLAHSMGLKVIAEGVETQEQLKMLRMLHCDEVQGFLFSKAIPADAFAALLRGGRRLGA